MNKTSSAEPERLSGLIDADWCYGCEREKDDCVCMPDFTKASTIMFFLGYPAEIIEQQKAREQ